jgi:hypothetical protein
VVPPGQGLPQGHPPLRVPGVGIGAVLEQKPDALLVST